MFSLLFSSNSLVKNTTPICIHMGKHKSTRSYGILRPLVTPKNILLLALLIFCLLIAYYFGIFFQLFSFFELLSNGILYEMCVLSLRKS
jgi:hypothetical protein